MTWNDPLCPLMSPQEHTFARQLGERIARLRRERGLTQVQLAQMLGISQQQVLSFEKGRRRVPVSALPALADALAVQVDQLLGIEPKRARRGPTPRLQRQLELLRELPRSKQRFVSELLDTVLQQAS